MPDEGARLLTSATTIRGHRLGFARPAKPMEAEPYLELTCSQITNKEFQPDNITHLTAWGLPNNRTGLKQLIASFRLVFPDLHCTVDDDISADNKILVHWTVYGTHKGPFLGNQPTERLIQVDGMIVAHTENDRIIKSWILVDQYGILQQLGIVPPPKGELNPAAKWVYKEIRL